MKSYKNLWSICNSDATINEAIKRLKRSKRMRKLIKRKHYSDDYLREYTRNLLYNYYPKDKKVVYLWDEISCKMREVLIPDLDDLLIGHCVCIVLEPILYKGLYEHRYSSIRNRGSLRAKRCIERYIRKNPGKVKYCFKCDIYHFFASIDKSQLLSKFCKYIKDCKMIDLIIRILSVKPKNQIQNIKGIPLGFPTSPLFSSLLLQPLDHYIKENLKVDFYIAWADDMIIFGPNKKNLHNIKDNISNFLSTIGLKLKNNWQIFRFSSIRNMPNGSRKDAYRDLDFMGYRFFRNRTVLRKAILYRACGKAKRISRKQWPTIYDARRMMSYYGYFIHTATKKCFNERVKPFVNIKYLRNKISRKDKESALNKYYKLVSTYKHVRCFA